MSTSETKTYGHLRLYDLSAEWLAIEDEILASGGELTPELESKLDALEGAIEDKTDGYCYLIRQFELAAEAVREEEERIRALRKTRENAAQRLKDRLRDGLIAMGLKKVETGRFVARVQKNSRPSIAWTGAPEEIPPGYEKVTISADTQAAYEAYKAGETLPEGFVVTEGHHLRIQ